MFFRTKKVPSFPPKMTEVKAPVNQALILICEKCGENAAAKPGNNPACELKARLKDQIKSNGDKENVRAVLTSCVNLCPKEGIAVGICSTSDNVPKSRFFTLQGNLDNAAEAVLGQLSEGESSTPSPGLFRL